MHVSNATLGGTSEPILRSEFVSRIPQGVATLEIGPFASPTLTGPNVSYFDVLDAQQIQAECDRLGISRERVPEVIDFVSRDTELSDISRKFDLVYSSHAIEHTPDVYAHLPSVPGLLNEAGLYSLAIPDTRYCFDHYKALSTVGDAINAYKEKRQDCSLSAWIDRYTHGTHNDPARHWAGDHGPPPFQDNVSIIEVALREFESDTNASKMAPHFWFFTPDTFAEIVRTGAALGYTGLELREIYGTAQGTCEFFAVLERNN